MIFNNNFFSETTIENKIYELMFYRRTTRRFKDRPIEEDKLEQILSAGLLAPSGSNKSPYMIYVLRDPEVKKIVREEAEKVEKEFYEKKREQDKEFTTWATKKDLSFSKPHLTEAPVVLSISTDTRYLDKHALESTWLTIAYILLAIENEGLCSVTYTPEPHTFMKDILHLPDYLMPQILIPIGYPLKDDKKEPLRPDLPDRIVTI